MQVSYPKSVSKGSPIIREIMHIRDITINAVRVGTLKTEYGEYLLKSVVFKKILTCSNSVKVLIGLPGGANFNRYLIVKPLQLMLVTIAIDKITIKEMDL